MLRIHPTVWLSLVACLVFPPVWNAVLPHHIGAPISIVLTPPRPDDALTLPADHLVARLIERDHGVRNERPHAMRLEFELDMPGSYSIFGISSHEDSRPLTMWIDDARISAMAFFERTGSLRGDFERHRIATGVTLDAGTHALKLSGAHLFRRTFAIELRREAPLGLLRFAGLATFTLLMLALRSWLVARISLTPRFRLAASLAFAIGFAALPLATLAVASGSAFAAVVRSDYNKRERLSDFETYLASDEHRARRGRFSVALFGDSTHFWPHEPDHFMLPTLERALPPAERERIELYGIAAAAFSAFDYYLLLNRLVVEAPDLVVIPINIRSFSSWWAHLETHDFRGIQRYLRIEELISAQGVDIGEREILWSHMLTARADALFGGSVAPFLRGLQRYLQTETLRALDDASPSALRRPAPELAAALVEPPTTQWPGGIAPDDPLIWLFRRIGQLAARHEIRVLYYSVQTNVRAQLREGVRVNLPRRFSEIGARVAQTPNVTFLDLSHDNPEWMFTDSGDHLSEEGMEAVADRLAISILALRDAAGI